jgi:hypothetical protein
MAADAETASKHLDPSRADRQGYESKVAALNDSRQLHLAQHDRGEPGILNEAKNSKERRRSRWKLLGQKQPMTEYISKR